MMCNEGICLIYKVEDIHQLNYDKTFSVEKLKSSWQDNPLILQISYCIDVLH